MHLPDARLLMEGQSEVTAVAAAAATGAVGAADGSSGGHRKRFGWIRQQAMCTGEHGLMGKRHSESNLRPPGGQRPHTRSACCFPLRPRAQRVKL